MKWKRFGALFCALAITFAVGCRKKEEPEPTAAPTTTQAEPEPSTFSLTTGLPVEEQSYPIAVSMPNDPSARPHHNINKADVVYEVFVEGNITRFIAVFGDEKPEEVGPVRSGRIYMVDIVDDWNAAFVHFGGSEGGNYDLGSKIRSSKITNDLDGMSDASYIQRVSGRKSPNNAFVNLKSYADSLDNEPIETSPFAFAREGVSGFEEKNWVKLQYSSTNIVGYEYEDGVYKRTINDKEFIDAATQEQVSATNVVVQKVNQSSASKGLIGLDMVGSGEVTVYTGGQRIEGTWERSSSETHTVYKDGEGNVIALQPGKTWVQMVTEKVKITD